MDASTRQREPQNYTVDLAFAHPIGAKVIREDDDITTGRFGCPARQPSRSQDGRFLTRNLKGTRTEMALSVLVYT